MLADEKILRLPKVSLKTKELLPEYSGIYYVVDQDNMVMYIGKAKNLQKRWQGNSHHRINQLKATRKRQFHLYYEKVAESNLDQREKILIRKYRSELNDSPVTLKEIYFAELVLQEALRKLNGYIIIVGINNKDKHISILFDYAQFIKDFAITRESTQPILNFLFRNRRNAAVKWEVFTHKYGASIRFYYASLKVNGYNITFTNIENLYLEQYSSLHQFTCMQVDFMHELVPQISLEDLRHLKIKRKSYQTYSPYKEDLVPYLATTHNIPSIDKLRKQLQTICHEYQAGKRGTGSKTAKINLSLQSIDDLLLNKPTTKITSTLSHYKNNHVSLYINCFYFNDFKKNSFNSLVYGKINNSYIRTSQSDFENIYLLSGCNPKIWQLLKDDLGDFFRLGIVCSDPEFPNNTGYVKKLMISPRRYITPARVSIKFESVSSSFSLPFGQDINQKFTTFEVAKAEIIRRLHNADLPPFKLTFTPEKIVTKGRR
ncbi:GIY-YIG nuclease family protein [Picosynechococcus sp. PCC 8807]|uniref:GIY-YIG nuclease family protein n=1 Tax=Picosynechococcus sp. PCC 8807 TaxID=195248 RepID=UPI000810DA6A|nr:GIY-YIG nuclease family protein [Picosynechococcus sp. PCC 8807]ANV89324.1 hypothetical protein AWQ24_00940 [Picosynechococcus sp. PCC 8807]